VSTRDPDGTHPELTPGEAATLAELTTELDAGRALRDDGHRSGHVPPRVELGRLIDGGLAPAIAAIVERGVRRRPHRANRLALEVELKVTGPYPVTRVRFSPGHVLVEDGPADGPMLRIEGALTDLVSLLSTPVAMGGVPNPITPRGRAALSKVATGKVRFEGPLALRREILALLRI
jgi:hypothetical protein